MGTLIAIIVLFSYFTIASAATVIENLQVEYTKTPIDIDVTTPRFTWQMSVTTLWFEEQSKNLRKYENKFTIIFY